MIFFNRFCNFYKSIINGPTDQLTDRRTDIPSYRDVIAASRNKNLHLPTVWSIANLFKLFFVRLLANNLIHRKSFQLCLFLLPQEWLGCKRFHSLRAVTHDCILFIYRSILSFFSSEIIWPCYLFFLLSVVLLIPLRIIFINWPHTFITNLFTWK